LKGARCNSAAVTVLPPRGPRFFIVHAHGGEIEAWRREGGGARFIFTLPTNGESA
jgi:hypothetical protein